MARYALKRLLQMIPLLLLVSLISFGLIKLVPGDPAVVMGGSNALRPVADAKDASPCSARPTPGDANACPELW